MFLPGTPSPPKFTTKLATLTCLDLIDARRVDGDRDALQVKEALSEQGIMVRHYSKPASISGCIRVSVGKPEQTDALERALSAI